MIDSSSPPADDRPQVTLYTRDRCHLCNEIKHRLALLRREADFEIREVNIDESEELRKRYGERVPVVAINGREAFDYRIDTKRFLELLKAEA